MIFSGRRDPEWTIQCSQIFSYCITLMIFSGHPEWTIQCSQIFSYCITLMIFSGCRDPEWTIQCSTYLQLLYHSDDILWTSRVDSMFTDLQLLYHSDDILWTSRVDYSMFHRSSVIVSL